MYKYLKYSVTPLITLLTMLGILVGGSWMWMGLIAQSIISIGGDFVLGDDPSVPKYRFIRLLQIPLFLALPLLSLLLLALAWMAGSGQEDFLGIGALVQSVFSYDLFAARSATTWSDYLGGILGVGFSVAGYGTNIAHELTHRTTSPLSMLVGRWLLSMSCNADFSIEHVYGHHVRVGTEDDPATARRGESVYGFFVRSSFGSHRSAWRLERERLSRKNLSVFSWHNLMLTGYLMSIVWAGLFWYVGGGKGLVLFLAQAFIAKFLLEATNYMEHYGLVREPSEPVRPEHSWNTNKRASSIVLYTLTRHSAHHEQGNLPFWLLDPYVDAPQMPHGYLGTMCLCLIPPLWWWIINPRLKQWDAEYGPATGNLPAAEAVAT